MCSAEVELDDPMMPDNLATTTLDTSSDLMSSNDYHVSQSSATKQHVHTESEEPTLLPRTSPAGNPIDTGLGGDPTSEFTLNPLETGEFSDDGTMLCGILEVDGDLGITHLGAQLENSEVDQLTSSTISDGSANQSTLSFTLNNLRHDKSISLSQKSVNVDNAECTAIGSAHSRDPAAKHNAAASVALATALEASCNVTCRTGCRNNNNNIICDNNNTIYVDKEKLPNSVCCNCQQTNLSNRLRQLKQQQKQEFLRKTILEEQTKVNNNLYTSVHKEEQILAATKQQQYEETVALQLRAAAIFSNSSNSASVNSYNNFSDNISQTETAHFVHHQFTHPPPQLATHNQQHIHHHQLLCPHHHCSNSDNGMTASEPTANHCWQSTVPPPCQHHLPPSTATPTAAPAASPIAWQSPLNSPISSHLSIRLSTVPTHLPPPNVPPPSALPPPSLYPNLQVSLNYNHDPNQADNNCRNYNYASKAQLSHALGYYNNRNGNDSNTVQASSNCSNNNNTPPCCCANRSSRISNSNSVTCNNFQQQQFLPSPITGDRNNSAQTAVSTHSTASSPPTFSLHHFAPPPPIPFTTTCLPPPPHHYQVTTLHHHRECGVVSNHHTITTTEAAYIG